LGNVFRWSLATITTVGCGDAAPVTALGKAVGNIFTVPGIAILSAFISSLLAFFIKSATPKTLADEVKEAIKKRVDDIGNTMTSTSAALRVLRTRLKGGFLT
jgi:voltage-gated potassium channel